MQRPIIYYYLVGLPSYFDGFCHPLQFFVPFVLSLLLVVVQHLVKVVLSGPRVVVGESVLPAGERSVRLGSLL